MRGPTTLRGLRKEHGLLGVVLLAGGALGAAHSLSPTRVSAAEAVASRPKLGKAEFGQAPLLASLAGAHDTARQSNSWVLDDGPALLATPGRPPLVENAQRLQIEGWIEDLRDDEEKRNAYRAYYALLDAEGDASLLLHRALKSPDYQQRQLAAMILGRRGAAASERLIAVTFEGLASDALPLSPGGGHRNRAATYTPVAKNARDGLVRLIGWGEASWPRVSLGLVSSDGQQCFASALVLAHTRCPKQAWRITAVLTARMRSNNKNGDALEAYRALRVYGSLCAPHLAAAVSSADGQSRPLLALLQQELARPSSAPEERLRRRKAAGLQEFFPDTVSDTWGPPGSLTF